MIIKCKEALKDLEGKELKDADGSIITNAKIFINALITPQEEDHQLSGEEKLKRFQLAQKFFHGDEVEVTSEEVTTLKTLVAKLYSVLIVGQILEWLK